MRTHRHLSLVILAAGLVLGLGSPAGWPASPAHAAPKKTRGCPAGRFVVTQGQELLGGTSEPAVLVVQGSAFTVEGPCPGTGKAKGGGRKGTRLTARWDECGTVPKLRLRAKARDCSAVRGTLRARKQRASLVAMPSACGDGIVDRGGAEQCDGAQGCAAGVQCSATCQCDGPAPEPLECETVGYPCAWSEVPADVRTRSIELGNAAAAVLEAGGTTAEAARTLEAAPLAEIQYDDDLLRFRLSGGRPVWLARPGVLNPQGDAPALSAPAVRSNAAPDARGLVGSPRSVVHTGEIPKKALVLDGYGWELGMPGTEIVSILQGIEGYQGNVSYRANATEFSQDVNVFQFTRFAEFSVVVVNAHGGVLLEDREKAPADRRGFVDVGEVSDAQAALLTEETGVDLLGWEGNWALAVNADFFRAHYPGGLKDALVVFNSCDVFASDLGRAIEGSNSNVAGWSGKTTAAGFRAVVHPFLERLGQGRAIAEVYASLGEGVYDPTKWRGKFNIGSQNIRIRELPRVIDAFTGETLTSSSTIQVTGYPDDGQPDGLLLVTEFDGVGANEGDRYLVHVTIDDVDMALVPLSEFAEPVGDYRWRSDAQLDLGFDVTEGQPLDIRVTVGLPEQGTSVFAATPRVTGPTFSPGRVWQGTFTRISADGKGVHWRLEATATFERDPTQSPTSKHPTYLMKSGTMTWSVLEGSECNYSATATVTPLAPDEYNYFTFDLTKQPIEYSGFAQSEGPPVNVTVDCPDLGDTNVSIEAGGTWFLAPLSEHYTVTGASIAGSHHNGAELASTFEWSLLRVE